MTAAPRRIVAGPVTLELHGPDDAERVADVINANLDHLSPWMPWAHRPTTAHEQAVRLAMVVEQAERGGDASYSIVRDGFVIGGCGLHQRNDPDTLDIGYWIAQDEAGRGYVRAAAAGLLHVAFEHYRCRRARITCDEANVRSASVAQRLGFTHVDTIDEERSAPADTNRTMVWELLAADWPESPGARVRVSYA